MNSNDLIPYVLSLNYSRDICAKFSSHGDLQKTHESQKQHAWHVLGSFDNLEVQADVDLEAMRERIERERRDKRDGSDLAIGAHSGLILVPFDDFFGLVGGQCLTSNTELQRYREFVDRVVMHLAPANKPPNDDVVAPYETRCKFPLLVVCRFYLSAIAYELESSFHGVLTAIDCMRNLLQEKASRYRKAASEYLGALPSEENLRFFRTLGSPDIVMLVLPRTPEELFGLHHFLDQVRETTLQDLVKVVSEALPTLPVDQGQVARSILRNGLDHPGHAFASVEDTLSFRTPLPQTDDAEQQPEFRYASGRTNEADRECESLLGLRLDFRLRLDCGHESDFLNYFRACADQVHFEADDKTGNPRRFGGLYTLQGHFDHMDDFVHVWGQELFEFKFRAANIIDSVTVPSFVVPAAPESPMPRKSMTRLAWRLRPGLDSELKIIEDTLHQWARTFLSAEQHGEFLGIVRTFRSCFYHHELPSAARDLLPFMRQLACACSCIEMWQDYRAYHEGNIEAFSADVQYLLAHLHRAVRNRLEHRARHADPTIPHTLSHGASKLINAYTTVYWLCGELFSRDETGYGDEYCVADNLAVCVAAGSEGRVNFHEIFNGFREYVEKVSRNGPLAKLKLGEGLFGEATTRDRDLRQGKGWTSRLMLMDVSGFPLFQPEQSFIHAIHETAEFSDWYDSAQTRALSTKINKWILTQVECILRQCLLVEFLCDESNMPKVVAETWCSFAEMSPQAAIRDKCLRSVRFREWNRFVPRALELLSMKGWDPDFEVADMKWVTTFSPILFFDRLNVFFGNRGQEATWWTEAANKLNRNTEELNQQQQRTFAPLLTRLAIRAMRSSGFEARMESLSELIPDITADLGQIGMFCHATRLVNREITIDDIHNMFAAIMATFVHRLGSASEWLPGNRSTSISGDSRRDEWQNFLLRWAISVRVVSPGASLSDSARSLFGMLGEQSRMIWNAFDSGSKIASLVSDFGPLLNEEIGLSAEIKLPRDLHEFGFPQLVCGPQKSCRPAERALLVTAIETWNAKPAEQLRLRLRLMMELWAKSARLRVEEAFIPYDADI